MGFLDHSTNNIIVDAVLTDVGREKLASATASENFVAAYAFADDEIDYTMIKKYGTIVGKEKIEKNTPIFEASTNAELGVKYYLSTSANPIVAQPTLTTTVTKASLSDTVTSTTMTIALTDNENILPGVEYYITYDRRFIGPKGAFQPKDVPNNRVRRFIVVDSPGKEDITIRFERVARGREILNRIGKKTINTSIEVRSSTGIRKRVPLDISYE